jgi:hypothetical protein
MSQPPSLPPDGSPPVPSWAPAWTPPQFATPGPVGGAPARRTDTLVLVLVGLTGLLVGIVGAGLVVTVLFAGSAGQISRAIADDVRTAVEEGITDGMEGGVAAEEYHASGPVEEFPPTAPGDLGPDPVLNAYAQGCFAGDLRACDDLYNTSPPLSRYEEYAAACAGRVKPYSVMSCTELE